MRGWLRRKSPGVTCVRLASQGPIGADDSEPQELVKVEPLSKRGRTDLDRPEGAGADSLFAGSVPYLVSDPSSILSAGIRTVFASVRCGARKTHAQVAVPMRSSL